MKKCLRCGSEMKEKFYVKTEREDNLGKVRAAVRPECGYLVLEQHRQAQING